MTNQQKLNVQRGAEAAAWAGIVWFTDNKTKLAERERELFESWLNCLADPERHHELFGSSGLLEYWAHFALTGTLLGKGADVLAEAYNDGLMDSMFPTGAWEDDEGEKVWLVPSG